MDDWNGFAVWLGRDWWAKVAAGTRNISGFDIVVGLYGSGMRRRELETDSAYAAAGGEHPGGEL